MPRAPIGFQGHCRRARSFGEFTLTEASYPSQHSLPLHAHDNPFFALLLSGSYTEKLEQGERRCAPSSLAYYPAGIPHADEFHGHGGRAFLIEVSTRVLEALGLESGAPSYLGEISSSRLNLLALRLYAASRNQHPDGDVVVEEIGLDMVGELWGVECATETRAPGWLNSVVARIHDSLGGRVRINELAARAGVHPVYLSRVFRRHVGCGIGAYVQRLRVQHACAALVCGDESLSGLAARLGYADQAHFTRRFTESVGVTPGRFRTLASE